MENGGCSTTMHAIDERERPRAIQALANHPVFERATPQSIERLVRNAELSKGARGELIIREGEPPRAVTFVLEGVVRIYHVAQDGREFTPKILSAPNHFGDVELIAGHEWNGQSVELLGDGIVASIPWDTIREILLSDHAVCAAWLAGLASQFVYTIDADRHNVFSGLPGRVANVLLSYAEVFGRETKRGLEIELPLSLERISKEVGSVKRSILRVLKSFESGGLVEGGRAQLIIRSARALKEQTLPRRLGLMHATKPSGLLQG
jgi:CRP/FNR family transcriptional regulator, cyclic AMP receptor protein